MVRPEHTPDAELDLAGVIEKYYDAVKSNALYVTRSEHAASDVTQSVFTLLVERWDKLKHDRIGAWIFAAERRKLLEFFREKERGGSVLPLDEMEKPDAALSAEDKYFELTDAELEAVRDRVLSVLSDGERELYEAYFVEGRTYEDICALYSLTYYAATSRVKRIRRKLERSVKENGPDTLALLAASSAAAAFAARVIFCGR